MIRRALLALALGGLSIAACSQEAAAPATAVVNVYSGRHYDADRAMFAAFTAKTGVDVRVIEAEGAQLLERLKTEGEYTNADVIMTVDAGNLARLVDAGLLQSSVTPAIAAVTPERYRDPQGLWFAFARRARVIVYAKDRVTPDSVASMDDLTKPAFRGKVCARQSSNLYNLSLMAARIEREGAEKAQAWAQGVAANFARPPQGSDTDQLRAVAAGVCDVAIANHYYLARMQASDDPADRAIADKLAIAMPDQAGAGAHVNISGAGISAHAKNRDNAVKLLEFLATPEAQTIVAVGNEEFPVVDGVTLPAPLTALTPFKEEQVTFSALGARQAEAQRLFDAAGWR